MARFTRSLHFNILATILVVVLTMGIGVKVPAQMRQPSNSGSLSSKLENAFRTPISTGTFVNTQGESAGNTCFLRRVPFIALVPASGVGETAAFHPTVFWYMPTITPDVATVAEVEFVLKDANNREVYSAKYPLVKPAEGVVGVPSIMSLTVASLYPLEIGQDYHWELTFRCDANETDRSSDITMEGGFKRVAPNPTFAQRLQQATPEGRVALYADERLWYETLAALIELRRDRPNDTNLAEAWRTLLTSVGLEIIANETVYFNSKSPIRR